MPMLCGAVAFLVRVAVPFIEGSDRFGLVADRSSLVSSVKQ